MGCGCKGRNRKTPDRVNRERQARAAERRRVLEEARRRVEAGTVPTIRGR